MGTIRRVQAVPAFQWSFDSGRQFKHLSPAGKDRVFRSYFLWLEGARKRDAEYQNMKPDSTGLDEQEMDCLDSLIENTCSGFDTYWSRSKQRDAASDSLRQSDAASDSLRRPDADKEEKNKRIKELKNIVPTSPKKVTAQLYHQREYTESETEEALGVRDLF